MNGVEVFGFAALAAMVVTYALENRSSLFVLAFAACCAMASLYALLIGSWPFALAEAIWCVIAVVRWRRVNNTRAFAGAAHANK